MQTSHIQFSQGLKYTYAVDGDQDLSAAAESYRAAGAAGHTPSLILLGVMYFHGKGVGKDIEQAESLFRKAATGGNPDGHYRLGICLHGREEYVAAMKQFEVAVDLGDLSAMVHLGTGHKLGWGAPQNTDLAFDWYLAAALLGHRDAEKSLAGLVRATPDLHRHVPEVTAILELSQGEGDRRASFDLGLFYQDGLLNRDRAESEILAFRSIKKASDNGLPEADAWCGEALVMGYGCNIDILQGVALLERAITKGNLDAKKEMACLLSRNSGVKNDPARAFSLMKEVAESGDSAAQQLLSLMYEGGIGTKIDLVASRYWAGLSSGSQ